MKRIVTREEMRQLEQHTICGHFISSLILMERAALSVCDFLLKEQISLDRPLIVCGTGNNGGDGLAIARILCERGYHPEVVLTGSRERCTEETMSELHSLESYGVQIHDQIANTAYTVVIDAIFGIGLSREISGACYDLIEQMNQLPAVKVAVDIPSGIDSNSGAIMGIAFKADTTVTFACAKVGMYLYTGTDYCGKVVVCDIGIGTAAVQNAEEVQQPILTMYETGDAILPERVQPSHKGTYGKVLLIAGSSTMCGAALLAAEAIMRTGTGMVKVVTTKENRDPILMKLPEAMLLLYDDEMIRTEAFEQELKKSIEWADVIGMGPGISESETAKNLTKILLNEAEKPLVIDADALNLIAANQWTLSKGQREVIVTPHIKEMERLSGKTAEELKADPIGSARSYAKQQNVICVLKDARTVTTAPDGNASLNVLGNSGMATAGAGDVLLGIICALKAQKLSAYEAASKGVYLHAAAGDYAASKKSEYGMTASDMIDGLVEIEPEMKK